MFHFQHGNLWYRAANTVHYSLHKFYKVNIYIKIFAQLCFLWRQGGKALLIHHSL